MCAEVQDCIQEIFIWELRAGGSRTKTYRKRGMPIGTLHIGVKDRMYSRKFTNRKRVCFPKPFNQKLRTGCRKRANKEKRPYSRYFITG